MPTRPAPIRSLPGIKRDGTMFEGSNYVDALWCRFQRGLPRKIGGYRAVTSSIPEIARGMGSFSSNGTQFLYMGGATTLTQVQVDSQGLLLAQSDRTPAGFAASPDNLWQFDTMYNSVTTQTSLIAHAAPNLSNIDNTAVAPIYAGNAIGAAVLTDLGVAGESGGICVVPPFLFKFGTNGHIAWSAPNDPSTFNPADEAFIANGSKLVCGSRMRGGNAPSALFWSTDSLERANFTSGTPLWDFDTMAGESSILSAQGVVENDGLFFWPGVDRFLVFNGVVREVPNNLNINWFYDNVNFAQRQKVFGIKIPRWGEIWWLFPFGNATECTHAIIYNVREEVWYDTALPVSGRSAGIFAKVYAKPFMVDRQLDPTTSLYTVWQHETGTDAINGSSVQPIPSYFETAEMSAVIDGGTDKALHTDWIEPDFVQTGDMTVIVTGRSNPRAPDIASSPKTFPAAANTTEQQTVPVKETRRLLRFRFTSNVAGGNYEMGQPLAHVDTGTGRKTT